MKKKKRQQRSLASKFAMAGLEYHPYGETTRREESPISNNMEEKSLFFNQRVRNSSSILKQESQAKSTLNNNVTFFDERSQNKSSLDMS